MSRFIFSISLSMAASFRPRSHSRLFEAEYSFPLKISQRGLSGTKAMANTKKKEKQPLTFKFKSLNFYTNEKSRQE